MGDDPKGRSLKKAEGGGWVGNSVMGVKKKKERVPSRPLPDSKNPTRQQRRKNHSAKKEPSGWKRRGRGRKVKKKREENRGKHGPCGGLSLVVRALWALSEIWEINTNLLQKARRPASGKRARRDVATPVEMRKHSPEGGTWVIEGTREGGLRESCRH